MEDQKRGMESYRKKIPSVKKKYPHDAESTVMIMRSIGKVRSFKISRRLVFNTFLFLFIYIVVSLLIINDYFIIDKDLHLRRISSLQSEKIKELEREVSKRKKDIHKFKQHIALLNDLITNFQNGLEDEKKPYEKENLRKEGSIQDVEPTAGPVDQKRRLANVVEKIPLERLLIETDSPFLAPVPFRGKRNESGYVTEVADRIASLHQVSPFEIAEITTENALNLFHKAS